VGFCGFQTPTGPRHKRGALATGYRLFRNPTARGLVMRHDNRVLKYAGKKEYLLVYLALITAARMRGLITYDGIREIMGLTPGDHAANEIGTLLGDISWEEVKRHNRPMLSALAISVVDGMPSRPFFEFAQQLERFQGSIDSKTAKHKFWRQERDKVYDEWNQD